MIGASIPEGQNTDSKRQQKEQNTMKRAKKEKQPRPKTGMTFTGWATFNWGVCHNRVYRTRRQAIEACCKVGQLKIRTWDEAKDYMAVAKVKCTVL